MVQAIYGVLSACANSGLPRRIEPAGHPARFEQRAGTTITTWCGRTWNRSMSMDS